jgi:ABC-type transport system substrate-binding protein/KaiC/GvpD/RAD55 family RecA-like ATPase
MIANNLISMGIDAKLEIVNSDVWATRLFFLNSTQGALYNQGGYDMGFIGWASASPIPDWRSNFDGRPQFLAPTGNNYALYNSTELNGLFDQLYASTDIKTQIDLVHKWQEIVFNDSPYAYIVDQGQLAARNQKWTAWGGKNVFSALTYPDIQHYSGGNNYTVAVDAPFYDQGRNLDPLFATENNAGIVIAWPILGSGAGLLDVDSRDFSYYPGLATNVTVSPDGLDWTVQIRKGALWQSGVEITADDFVWTRWAEFSSRNPNYSAQYDIANLGNVIDFTFLNGTTVTVDNRASSNETVRSSWWKAIDRYTFQFHLSQPFAFTREVYCGFAPLPKHILEKFPSTTWDNISFSTANGPYTYTWDTKQYGGTGSYTAVGPVGDGPYYLQSYNFTTNVATLKKFNKYWNATGLEALGQFTVETLNVVAIRDKTIALGALGNGQVDQIETLPYWYPTRWYLSGSDVPTLQSFGVNVIPASGFTWQELGFNMKHPVFGTGVDTPLGKSNPSMAAEAARHVRKAISHLIPRDEIVKELLDGMGVPLASFLGPEWGVWYNKDLTPDSFDKDAAAAELRAAGYTVGGISTLNSTQPATAFSVTLLPIGGAGIAVAVMCSVVVAVRRGKLKIRRRQSTLSVAQAETIQQKETYLLGKPVVASKPAISTGYPDLDGTLGGGIPEGYAVVLVSPSYDERDLLMRKIIDSALSSGRAAFYISSDIERTQDLLARYRRGFYAFSSQADKIATDAANLYKIPYLIENLSEANISLTLAFKQARASEQPSKMIVIIDILSDLLVRYRGITTRRWLSDFVGRRKVEGFTTLATLNPLVGAKEDSQMVIDFFDGVIEIFEKELQERSRRFVVVKKMYGKKYSESELMLDKEKLF